MVLLLEAVESLLQDARYKLLLSVVKGFRNGLMYVSALWRKLLQTLYIPVFYNLPLEGHHL